MSTPWWFFLIAAGLIVMSGFFERRAGGAGEHRLDVQLDVALEERLLRLDVGGGNRGVGGHCARCLRRPRRLSRRAVRALPHFEAQVSESSRFYAARGALLMRREVRPGVSDVA